MNSTVILGVVRHLLSTGGGAALLSGAVSDDDLQKIIGAVLSIGSVIWSVMQKRAAAAASNSGTPPAA